MSPYHWFGHGFGRGGARGGWRGRGRGGGGYMAGNVGQGQGPFYGQPYVSRRGPGQDVETRLTQVDNFSKQTEMSLNLDSRRVNIYRVSQKKV